MALFFWSEGATESFPTIWQIQAWINQNVRDSTDERRVFFKSHHSWVHGLLNQTEWTYNTYNDIQGDISMAIRQHDELGLSSHVGMRDKPINHPWLGELGWSMIGFTTLYIIYIYIYVYVYVHHPVNIYIEYRI